MLDFTSALYLGMYHPSSSLQPWKQFTTGVPSALKRPSSYIRIAQSLALLLGCEDAILGPSTLHLFWDLFGMLSRDSFTIYIDAGTYPIARWGVERAAARGVRAISFPHHDVNALIRMLKRDVRSGTQPLVVTDGWCPSCGKFAPINGYLSYLRRFDGLLIIDDTQALGIFGHKHGPDAPYGTGGGGSLCWHDIHGIRAQNVLVVSSLAKGFGVPMAVLGGSRAMVRHFDTLSETLMHCSPPSIAALHAAGHALSINRRCGETLRIRLARLVSYFVKRAAEIGLNTTGGLSPVQTIWSSDGMDAKGIYERLYRSGIHTVLRRSHCLSQDYLSREGHGGHISFILTVRHTQGDIDRVMEVLSHIQKAYFKKQKNNIRRFEMKQIVKTDQFDADIVSDDTSELFYEEEYNSVQPGPYSEFPGLAEISESEVETASLLDELLDELDELLDEGSEEEFEGAPELFEEEFDDELSGEINRRSPGYIRWVQSSLNRIMGFNLKIDGIIGPQTSNAIRRFQKKKGLKVDGIVGPKTEAALIASGAGRVPGAGPGRITKIPVIITGGKPFAILDQFSFDSSALRKDSSKDHYAQIDAIARKIVSRWLSSKPVHSVCIDGHTDDVGGREYNYNLGKRRARTVKNALCYALWKQSIAAGRKDIPAKMTFVVNSYGEDDPLTHKRTPVARAKNRRVEVFLLSEKVPGESCIMRKAPKDKGLASCMYECEREFQSCLQTSSLLDCLRKKKRCQRECRGILA